MPLNKKSKILLYSSNIWYFGEGLLGPLFAVFAEKVGGDILSITWAWATYLILTGISYIIVGKYIAQKFNKKKLMLSGYVFNTIFTFGYILVSKPWHLFIIQAGLGVSLSMATPTWNSLYTSYAGKEKNTALRWGLADGQATIVTGISVILGGLIVNSFSFNILFITMGIIQIFATLYQFKILKYS